MISAIGIVVVLAFAVLGAFIGWLVKPMKAKLITGGLLVAAPFIVLVPIFLMAESSGCSGGDCGGAMMLLGFLALFMVPAAVAGLGVLAQALFAGMSR